ncbi:MAG TPA: hypothetical protein VM187_11285 [Niastella sp.]|nr:hypothetical protein [Niastella sp.]
MRIVLIMILLMTIMPGAYTQPGQLREAGAMLQKLAAAYQQPGGLQFSVLFRYAAEATPNNWLDSLNGRVSLNGQQYWYDINNTTTVCTRNYIILLFKEDQVMYLRKPATGESATAPGMTGTVMSPMSQTESFLKNDSTIHCTVNDGRHQRIITITFTNPSVYKRIEYYINKRTGLLEKMINVVRTDQLYDPSVRPALETGESYAVVEAVYSGYQPGITDSNVFNSERYFKKEGSAYVTVAPYENYKIFLGSSNL